jgi:probable selenium-dependent hydroxylase accessory protein YqeC
MCEVEVTLDRELLALGPGIFSLTGGGGKTALLYALGLSLAALGYRVLCTTSTRIARPDPSDVNIPPLLELQDPRDILLPAIPSVKLAGRPADAGEGKLHGYSAEEIDDLWQRRAADFIIVEADGAKRRPLKAPSDKEPVIPGLSAAVLAVAGLSALGQPFSAGLVFRPAIFAALSGLELGQILTAAAVAQVILHPMGLFKNTPAQAARLVFLNQADLPGAWTAGLGLAQALLSAVNPPDAVYLGAAHRNRLQCLKLSK